MQEYLNSDILIKIKHISKSFSNKNVLDNLNLNIYKNEILLLLGKSGCGKSTLFKILLSFLEPDSGSIYYKNYDIVSNKKRISKLVGFVSQENSFYEKLTVKENLEFYAKLYGLKNLKEIEYRINYLLKELNLDYARNVLSENLSGGMKRRLEFAISLIHDPVFLILDEPFTGLDIEAKNNLWKIIEQVKNSKVTILISTHDLIGIENYADRIVFLHKKKIIHEINLRLIHEKINLEKVFQDIIKK